MMTCLGKSAGHDILTWWLIPEKIMKPLERYPKLLKAALILLIVFLSAWLLKAGAPFLIPIAFGALLAMLLFPVSSWLEKKGVNRAIATLIPIIGLLAVFAAVIYFISYQVSDLAESSSQIEKQLSEKYRQLQEYVSSTLGIPREKQEQMIKEQQSSSGGKMGTMVTGIIAGIGGMLTNIILVLVYIFLFLYFRFYLKRFILRVVPDAQVENTREIIDKSQKVTQKYLTGLALMIAALWVMYGIGFSIIGLKYAIFFAILCGILEIVPFIGNLIGNGLAILVSLMQGGDSNVIIGILITYAVVQFLQSYILEPLVVGREVNINPLFTILGLVAAEIVWGIPGMVLAIPIMGVTKIVCDHIEPLQPFGQLIGEDKKEHTGLKRKIKAMFGK
jgi:predicted PurR-regulated permease PerM